MTATTATLQSQEEEDSHDPLVTPQSDYNHLHSPATTHHASDPSSSDLVNRTGTRWTAVAHIITAVIGAGILSLAWSVAQLGWIAGPLFIIAFAGVTYVSSFILSDCYRYPHPELGPHRLSSYMDAVRVYLGERSHQVGGVMVQANLLGTAIAYTVTTANSIRAIQKSNCYHRNGGSQASCHTSNEDSTNFYMLVFGVVQVVMSQIPDYHNMEWLSIFSAIMSFAYALIAFGLGFAKVIENGEIKGSISGVPVGSIAEKTWLVFQAIGDIAFAYPYSLLHLEIQDTLKSSPSENKTMKKAAGTSIFITTSFFLCCGCFGYAAFGADTPGNLLTGPGFYNPYWLIDFANACIVLHLVGGYQMYSHPVYAFGEGWLTRKFPESRLVNNNYKLTLCGTRKVSVLRLCFRTTFVALTTGIAMMFPYFNQVLGVLGGLYFWPLTIHFPVEMYLVQKRLGAWTTEWILLRSFSVGCLLVSCLALVGSIQGLFSAKFG
ncbi:Probable amino acid permease 7 [Linum perenne]